MRGAGNEHPRSWWEILITPRDQLKVGAAQDWLPIDETYPEDRIVLTFDHESRRQIQVGTGAVAPGGWIADGKDWRRWRDIAAQDPALTDRRIRRTMLVAFSPQAIAWLVETPDGDFDPYVVSIPDGLPFTRGLVVFKTHAYTPEKDGNVDRYTFHWDEIKFSGPVVGRYESFETTELAYLQANGNRPIGDRAALTIDAPRVGPSPVLFGQLHGPLRGQVRLRVNGGPERVVDPLHYTEGNCSASGWSSFRVELDEAELVVGENEFEWEVGPRPDCAADWEWDGFSVKGLEVQVDLPPEAS